MKATPYRTYLLKTRAERRAAKLREMYPDKEFEIGLEPNGFRWVVYLNPQLSKRVVCK